jgi:hypothetical protein
MQDMMDAQKMQQMQRQNAVSGMQQALSGQMNQSGFDPYQSAKFQQYSAVDPSGAASLLKTWRELNDGRKEAFFKDAQTGKRLLEDGKFGEFESLAENRLKMINQFGGDPSDVTSVMNTYQSGDLDGTIAQLGQAVEAGILGEYLPDPSKGKPKEMTSLEKAQQKVDFEFRKEERQVAKTAVVGFNKRASEIRSSYGKIESILDGGKLNRMKIASAMTSMARLLSPGIVTNKDFESLSNSATPVAELLSRITGKGEQGANVAENLQRFYDPTNPDLFDKKSFLDTARNVAGAEIPALIDSFNGARDRAGRAGVSEKALDTNFGQNKNFDYLTGMLEKNKPVLNHSKLGNVTEGQIQETMKNKGMTREQVLALLQEGN